MKQSTANLLHSIQTLQKVAGSRSFRELPFKGAQIWMMIASDKWKWICGDDNNLQDLEFIQR